LKTLEISGHVYFSVMLKWITASIYYF